MTVPTWMSQMIETVADMGRYYLETVYKGESFSNVEEMCRTLIARRGEASGTALARRIVEHYNAMNRDEKIDFLSMLATRFAPDPETITAAAQAYLDHPDKKALFNLNQATEAPHMELLRLLNMAPDGTATIISMRELVLELLKTHPETVSLDFSLLKLLRAWFNRGFLQFQQIDWHTPAVILEKLIAYEAVHEIKGWNDLRRRLAKDRRCFAFFHPVLPDEPLIFVEVAFTKGIAETIKPLLGPTETSKDQPAADTAIFYSISNCQRGLKGISFGNFLIKQVVDSISAEMPNIKTFSTLSPIPNFNKWLTGTYLKKPTALFSEKERALLADPLWSKDPASREQMRSKIMKLCAVYLCQEKKRGRPFDPVSRFHLGNGAEIENINWEADLSDRGLEQSNGMMVNYRYNPSRIVANHESHVNEGRIVYSSKIKRLLE